MNPERMLRSLISACLILAISLPGVLFADPATAQKYYEDAALEYEKGNYEKAADLLYRAYAEDANLIYVYNRILALQAAGNYDESLKQLNVFENRMVNDPEKRFEDIPEVKKQLEERIRIAKEKELEKEKENENKDNKDNGNKDNNQVKDPGVTPKKSKGPGIVAISLLAGGGLLLGSGVLLSTGVFISERTEHQETVDLIDAVNENRISRQEYETQLVEIWVTSSPEEAIKDYEDTSDTIEGQQVASVILMSVGGALIVGGVIAWIVNVSGSDEGADDVPLSADRFQWSPQVSKDHVGAMFQLTF